MRPLDYQFRRLAFLQVLLGMLAFCIAEGRPVLLAIVGGIAVVSWFYTETAGRRGLDRTMLNLGAVGAVVLLTIEVQIMGASQPVALVGHFTMALQLVLLFAIKGRREYLQLVALSALQMLSASVLPGGVTLIYGILLFVYCVLALLTALTFQLKSCGDLVHERHKRGAAEHDTPDYPAPVGGPRQRSHFRRSAAVLGLLCAAWAVVVFVIAPRSQSDGLAVALMRPAGATSQTGFNTSIQLGQGPIGAGSTEPVLNLRLSRNNLELGSQDYPWLLRGSVLDYYNPEAKTWTRSHVYAHQERVLDAGDRGITLAQLPGQDLTQAVITLRRISEQNLFIPTPVEGPVATSYLRVPTQERVQFNIEDQQLLALAASSRVQEYQVRFPVDAPGDIREHYERQVPDQLRALRQRESEDALEFRRQYREQRSHDDQADAPWHRRDRSDDQSDDASDDDIGDEADDEHRRWRHERTRLLEPDRQPWSWDRGFDWSGEDPDGTDLTTTWPVQTERVRGLAQAVLAPAGLPPDLTDADPDTRELGAQALARHLRLNYAYTTDNPPTTSSDPVIGFLFQSRAGHCELFASGLAALCRSVGIPARLVTGFRASEFNPIGGYYVVRQSHAHAWTEINLGPGTGWVTLDATPPSAIEQLHANRHEGLLGSLQSLYDHLEFSWIATVITYDKRAQEELLGSVGEVLSAGPDSWARGSGDWLKDRAQTVEFNQVGYIMMGIISVALVIAVTSLIQSLILRRRRLIALQLTALPRQQRRLLARQLRFYITMLEILERHGHQRPHWQSPYRFARDLAEGDMLRFEPVVSLTELFYEVRFGRRTLDDLRKQQVRAHLRRLELTLSPSAKA